MLTRLDVALDKELHRRPIHERYVPEVKCDFVPVVTIL